jgi:hypothetical protein
LFLGPVALQWLRGFGKRNVEVRSVCFWGSDRASSSCWSFNLLREEFLSAPIHSPLSGRLIGPSPITFTEEDFRLKSMNHNDAMVIEVNIAGWVIRKILVDNGSSADILFLKTFEKMNLSRHMLHPPEYPLQGFGGKPIKPVEKVSLPVSFRDFDNARTETLTFDVVDIYHPYLVIFGRGFMNKFDAIFRQLCMKIPAPKGVITVFGDQQEALNI